MSYEVGIKGMLPGDTLLFKGEGPVFWFFSLLLSVFESDWRKRDWKPWHMAKAWEKGWMGWNVLEATKDGVEINYYKETELTRSCRAYHWIERLIGQEEMQVFLNDRISKRYDVVIYFWTMAQYLIRHYFNHRIPKLLDDRYTCWELAHEFDEVMGKPWGSKYDCVMLTDFLKRVG